jgi:hypothetical protein
MKTQIITGVATALVTFVVAVVTVPTDYIVGKLRFYANQGDLREVRYPKIATELSAYVFEAENFQEYFGDDITNPETLRTEIADYNRAISLVRADQYANRAIVLRYWGTDVARRYDDVMAHVYAVDNIAHKANRPVNDYLKKIQSSGSAPLKKPVAAKGTVAASPDVTPPPPQLSSAETQAVAKEMATPLDELCSATESFLLGLVDRKVEGVEKHCRRTPTPVVRSK